MKPGSNRYLRTIRPERVLWYSLWSIKSDGDFSRPATEPHGHGAILRKRRDTVPVGGKNPPWSFSQFFRGHLLHTGGTMSSHNDSFAASGSSPTQQSGPDFSIDRYIGDIAEGILADG